MNQLAPIDERRELSPAKQFRAELDKMTDQFAVALPSHIKPERFQRVVTTAVLSDPAVLHADRKSLLEAAIRAAQDGLLPDKREGAFVVFGKIVQWMPMIGGIIKKIHQSGEIAMISAKVVYGGDTFRSWVDDDGEHIAYEQAENPDYDTIRQVFAFAKTKDGAVYVETLTPRDIQKIRNVSRSKDKGPWVQWWEEMAKKSAIRRLAKRLPISAEIHDLLQRDNDMYDLERAPDPRPSLQERLSAAKAQGAPPASEGFALDYVTDQTADAASEPATTHSEASGDMPGNDPGGEEGDASAAGDLFPESEVTGQDDPPPAPALETLSDADRAWLVKVFKTLKAAVGPDVDVLKRQSIMFAEEAAGKSALVKAKATKIRTELQRCCGDDPQVGTIAVGRYVAGIIGVDERDLAD